MSDKKPLPIRVLIADDEAEVRDAYRQILCVAEMSGETVLLHNLRERLFGKNTPDRSARTSVPSDTTFTPVFCDGAEAAVAAVRNALKLNEPFAVAFLDMRMPPGPDGAWAAARIREFDPAIEIVVCTAYSDVDPRDIGRLTEGQAWRKYALASRIGSAGSTHGINVFLRGMLWDISADSGQALAISAGKVTESSGRGAAILNLWL